MSTERHREREVQEQGRGRLRPALRLDQLEVLRRQPRPGRGARSNDRVEHRLLNRDLTAVTEPPGASGAGGFGLPSGLARLVGGIPVLPEVLEHSDQGPFPHLASPARGDLEPATLPRHQPRLLERALDLLEPPEIGDRLLAQGPPELLLVDVLHRGARVVGPHRTVQILVIGYPLQRVHRGLHGHGLFAAGKRGLVPRHLREQFGEGTGQSIHFERKVEVLEDLPRQRFQLGPLLRRHRPQQPRQRGHPSCHLLQQLVERLRVLGEEVAVPLHETGEVEWLSPVPSLDHRVQLGQHVLEALQLLGRHAAHPLGHVAEVRT